MNTITYQMNSKLRVLFIAALAIFALAFSQTLNAQCNVACEAETIIRIGEDQPYVKIEPTVFFAHYCDGAFTLKIIAADQSLVFATEVNSANGTASSVEKWTIDANEVCQEYTSLIIEKATGNSCWGSVKIDGSSCNFEEETNENEENSETSGHGKDNKPPVVICLEKVSIAHTQDSDEITIWARDIDFGSFDFETKQEDLVFEIYRLNDCCGAECELVSEGKYADLPGPTTTFCRSDVLETPINVVLRVTDKAGASNECITELILVDKNIGTGGEGNGTNNGNGSEENPCPANHADLNDLSFPSEIVYENISMKDMINELMDSYEAELARYQKEHYAEDNDALIGYTYHDDIFRSEGGDYEVKIIRYLAFIDWCQFDPHTQVGLVEFQQIIKIKELENFAFNSISTSTNEIVPVSSMVLANEENETAILDFSCGNEINSILECTFEAQDWNSSQVQLEITRDEDCLLGLNVVDIIMIQRHILGIENFQSNDQYIAADLNSDNRVSATDLIKLRKLILGLDLCKGPQSSWEFYKSNLLTEQSFNMNMSQDYSLGFNMDAMANQNIDIVALKKGDVDINAISSYNQIPTKSNNTLILNDQKIEANKTQTLPIMISKSRSMIGSEITIQLDESFEILNLTSGEMNLAPENIMIAGNEAKIIWFENEAKSFDMESPIFEIELTSNEAGNLKEKISSGDIKMVAFENLKNNLGTVMNTQVIQDIPETSLELNIQNNPNSINFNLNSELQVISELTLFDISGRSLYNNSNVKSKNCKVGKEQLIDGILIYRIKTDQGEYRTGKVSTF